MKLALAAPYDITSPSAWSGTPLSLYTALQAQAGADEVCTVNVSALPGAEHSWPSALDTLHRRRLRTRMGDAWQNPARSKALRRWLAAEKPDALLQFGGYRTAASAIPYYIYSDSTHKANFCFSQEQPQLYAELYPGRVPEDSARAAAAVQPIYDEAAGIFCMSEWMAASLRRTGTDPSKVRVVHAAPNFHGQPVPQMQPKPCPKDRPVRLLLVGVDYFHKGGDVVTAALRLLNAGLTDPQYTIDFAGPKSVPADVLALPFVRSHGFCDKATLAELLSSADLFVMPSRFDCFGIAFLEAMSYALPCVGRDICAMPEFIRPGQNGALLQSNNPEELAALLREILTPERYPAYSAAALAASQEYRWEKIAAAIWADIRCTANTKDRKV